MSDIAGIVLAGGKSSRMGTDKASMLFAGETLLSRAFRALSPHCAHVFVSCGPLRGYPGYSCVHDACEGMGPISGIMAGMIAASKSNCSGVLVLACDLPLLDADFLSKLLPNKKEPFIARPFQSAKTGWLEMTAAFYSLAALPFFEQARASGEKKLRAALPPHLIKAILYDERDAWKFANCNAPCDLDMAMRVALEKNIFPS